MNVAHNKQLDVSTPGPSKHPVFGRAADADSLKTIMQISRVRTGSSAGLGARDCPIKPVVMRSVTVELYSERQYANL